MVNHDGEQLWDSVGQFVTELFSDVHPLVVALALHDPESDVGIVPGTTQRLAKAAYYYPIIQRTTLRPKRKVGLQALGQADEERIDELNLTVGELTEDDRARLLERIGELDPSSRPDAALAEQAVEG